MHKPLRLEIVFTILILMFIFIGFFAVIIIARIKTREYVGEQVLDMNRTIYAALEDPLKERAVDTDPESIRALFNEIVRSDVVSAVHLYSYRGEALISAGAPGVEIDLENMQAEIGMAGYLVLDDTTYFPLYEGTQNRSGMTLLAVQSDRNYFVRAFSKLIRTVMWVSSVFVSIIIFLSFVLTRIALNTPLERIVAAVEEVERGNYSPDLRIDRPREFRRFGEMFLKMLKEIKEKNAKLELYSQKLEEKVGERTRELDASVHQLKTAQQTIIQQEKMASIGELAAGVAHEINNPTGFVIGNLSVLREYLEVFKTYYGLGEEYISSVVQGDSDVQESVILQITNLKETEDMENILLDLDPLMDELSRGTSRIKNIVRGLRDFTRQDGGTLIYADINAGIEDAIKICGNQFRENIELVRQYGELPKIQCNIQRLEQVFINLLMNAADAVGSDGLVKISTAVEGNSIVVAVSDNGSGIEEDLISSIFNPFFTTKEVGRGTGLGLSISHGIIKSHGGEITVESSPGSGSTFTVKIPIQGET